MQLRRYLEAITEMPGQFFFLISRVCPSKQSPYVPMRISGSTNASLSCKFRSGCHRQNFPRVPTPHSRQYLPHQSPPFHFQGHNVLGFFRIGRDIEIRSQNADVIVTGMYIKRFTIYASHRISLLPPAVHRVLSATPPMNRSVWNKRSATP